MKCDGSIHSLIQGVSQQPPQIRFMGQCQLQENCSSNLVKGLTRRPPTNFINSLGVDLTTTGIFYDFKVKDIDYFLLITPDDMSVFNTTGNRLTTTISDAAKAYLDNTSKLAFTTINDITYIANPLITCKMLADVKSYPAASSLVHLIGGQYGRTYRVTVNWGANTQTFSFTTPNGSSASQTPQVATTYIATHLATAFNAIGALTAVFSIARADDVLLIQSTNSSSASFKVTVDDGDGGAIMFVTNNSVVDVGSLPRYAPQGYFTAITGSGTQNTATSADQYYLEFNVTSDTPVTLNTGFGQEGVWIETVKRDIPYLIDTTTMPVALTYDQDTASFSCDLGAWVGRQVGDLTTNADPSFIGNTITSLSHFQGRLVAYSNSNEIMTRTNKTGTDHILDFWRESATVLADTDGVDFESTTKNAKLEFGIPFNRDLVVFAQAAQFVTFGRVPVTPTSASLVLTTEFEFDANVKPVVAGRNIFYAIKYGNFTGIREYFNEAYIDTDNSRPITQHVTKYLKGRATQLSSSTTFDLLLVHTDFDKRQVYAYEFLWEDQVKKQSSWSTWIFKNPVLYSFFRQDIVYFVTQNGLALEFESMSLDVQNDLPEIPYPVMLDGKAIFTPVHTTVSNTLGSTSDLVFVQGTGCPFPGLQAETVSITDSTITFLHNMNGGTVIGGHRYTSRYQPTRPFIKDRDGVSVGTGTLIVSKFLVNYVDTGYFNYTITSPFLDTFSEYFNARILDDPDNLVGSQPIISGIYIMPYREDVSKTILEINSDSHLPFTVTTLEWKGQYTKKGTRMPQNMGMGLPGRY